MSGHTCMSYCGHGIYTAQVNHQLPDLHAVGKQQRPEQHPVSGGHGPSPLHPVQNGSLGDGGAGAGALGGADGLGGAGARAADLGSAVAGPLGGAGEAAGASNERIFNGADADRA